MCDTPIKMCNPFVAVLFVLLLAGCGTSRQVYTVWTIGDSTMADKKEEFFPETGWCQVLGPLLPANARLRNRAVNGRSTKSFIGEHRWQDIKDSLQKGDYLLIQFGHNDQKIKDSTRYAAPYTAYKSNLELFVAGALEKGATPVLLTPIVRRKFDEQGNLTDTHGDYPTVVREVARTGRIPLVDLEALTATMVKRAGPEKSKKIYLWTDPSPGFPSGRQDDTHLSREGAGRVARMAARELRRLRILPEKRERQPMNNRFAEGTPFRQEQ